MVGHVTPEAQVGGPIAAVRNGDLIRIDAAKKELSIVGDKSISVMVIWYTVMESAGYRMFLMKNFISV